MTKLTIVGAKKGVEPPMLNNEILPATIKRTNFDLVAAGVCPHDNAELLPPTRTAGAGEKAVCTQCGHTWYINQKIRTCKCLSCSADKRKVVGKVDIKSIGGSVWESNPPKTLLMPPDGFEVREAHRDSSAP
jgi:hypothetical protein